MFLSFHNVSAGNMLLASFGLGEPAVCSYQSCIVKLPGKHSAQTVQGTFYLQNVVLFHFTRMNVASYMSVSEVLCASQCFFSWVVHTINSTMFRTVLQN